MKAFCIEKAGGKGIPEIEIGDEVTIIGQSNSPVSGIAHVQLAEYPTFGFGGPLYYAAYKFSPLNGPCEVALLDERVERQIADLDRNWRGICEKLDKLEKA